MKKKDLLAQNSELFFKKDELQGRYNELLAENERITAQNEALLAQLEELKLQLNECMQKAEDTETQAKDEVAFDKQYAAKVIGEIVVSATMKCNALTKNGNPDNRELVNLILGRTEVAKAEILNISSLGLDENEEKLRIDNEKANAFDYFFSVLAQNN